MIPTRLVVVLLRATAVLNVLMGGLSVLMPAVNVGILLGPDVVLDPVALRYHLIMWLFVVAMGVGYGVASRDPQRQSALVVAGGLGKLAAVGVWTEMLIDGYGAWPMLGGIAWDGTLGVVLLLYAAGWRRD